MIRKFYVLLVPHTGEAPSLLRTTTGDPMVITMFLPTGATKSVVKQLARIEIEEQLPGAASLLVQYRGIQLQPADGLPMIKVQ